MNHGALNTVIEEYRTQRKYRQSKRNQFLRRFQVLKKNFMQINTHHQHHHHHDQTNISASALHQENHVHHHVQPIPQNHLETKQRHVHVQKEEIPNFISAEEVELLKENQELRTSVRVQLIQLLEIETEQKERLQLFKNEIQNVRNKYLSQIQKMTQTAKTTKQQLEQKMAKMQEQSEAAIKKNSEIEQTNKILKGQVNEANKLMGQYATEIKKQYSQKIVEFQKIFNTSNEKIEAMEKQFNEDQFIENTLKNEQLLKSIQQNAQKAEQAGKILQDYSALLQGKKQILVQINSNIEMKQKQIEKMIELEGKMKIIMDKLTSQKKIYVAENNKMASELLEIKNLLMGVMGQQK